ncbi:MAG TPA: hypothetical protein VK989_12965 [Polyangia bacterium]|nr:hypothetical protein [Polyangia bacterium]
MRLTFGVPLMVAVAAATAAIVGCGSDASRSSGVDGAADAREAGAAVSRGAGCGKALPTNQPMTVPGRPTGYLQYTVMGTGATLAGAQPQKAGPRTFWVRVPADYDPNRAYRVVYLGTGCGSTDASKDTYQLYREDEGGAEEAIYVAIDLPTDMVNMDCYDNETGTASQEWEAFDLFHGVVDANYCVDNDHVFVAGYSTGGWLANMWGCYFAGDGQRPWNGVAAGVADAGSDPRRFAPKYHIRGQGAVSGGEPPNNPPCNGPVAAIWIHDLNDISNLIAGDQAALARVLRMNGCTGSATAPWGTDLVNGATGACVQYTACPADYPVVFCTTNDVARYSAPQIAIPALTRLFEQVTP